MSIPALKSRIAAELDRGDLTDQIDQALETALKYYHLDRFYFAESRVEFTARAGVAYYAFPDAADIDLLELTAPDGRRHRLDRLQWSELREALGTSPTEQRRPQAWASYGACFGLWPTPDRAYQLNLSYVRSLPLDEGNPFLAEADDLLRYRTKREIYTHVTKDSEMAAAMAEAEIDLRERLLRHSERRKATGNNRARRI